MGKGVHVIAPFDLSSTSPLDSRQKWASLTTLQNNTTVLMPKGFRVFCVSENKWYQLSCSDETDVSTYAWTEDNVFDDSDIAAISANSLAIAANTQAIADNTTAIGTNTTNIGTNTQTISDLQTSLGTTVDDVQHLEADFTTLEQRVAGHDTAIGSANDAIDALETNVQTLQQDVIGAEGQIDLLETAVGTTSQNLETLQGTVTTLGQEYAGSKDDITALQGTTSGLSTSLSALSGRTDTVEDDIAVIEQDLENKVNTNTIGATDGIAPLGSDQLIPLRYIPNSVIEKMKIVTNDTARFALTTADVQNGDTVRVEETVVVDEEGHSTTVTGLLYYVYDDTHLSDESGYRPYTAGMASTAKYAESAPATGVSFSDATYAATNVSAALVEIMAETDALATSVARDIENLESTVADKMDSAFVSIEGSIKTYALTVTVGATVYFAATNATTDMPVDITTGAGVIQRLDEDEIYIELHNTDNTVVYRMYESHGSWSNWMLSPSINDTATTASSTWSSNKINTSIAGACPKTGIVVTGSIKTYAVSSVSENQCVPIITNADTTDVPTDLDAHFNMCTGTISARTGYARRITLNGSDGLTATCWCANADPQVWSSWYITGMIDDSATDANKTWSSSKINTMLSGKASTDIATTTANGLMSSTDKSKLDGVAENANNYSLPVATAVALGGMKVGDGLKIDTGGILSLNAQFVGTQAEWEAFDKTDFPDKGIVIITDD